jgi:hypothetical protein
MITAFRIVAFILALGGIAMIAHALTVRDHLRFERTLILWSQES